MKKSVVYTRIKAIRTQFRDTLNIWVHKNRVFFTCIKIVDLHKNMSLYYNTNNLFGVNVV